MLEFANSKGVFLQEGVGKQLDVLNTIIGCQSAAEGARDRHTRIMLQNEVEVLKSIVNRVSCDTDNALLTASANRLAAMATADLEY